MFELEYENNVRAKLWIDPSKVEDSAMVQIENVMKLPFLHKWVSIMPDCHAGHGATIGSVIPTEGMLIPGACGIDLSCGLAAMKTNIPVDSITSLLPDIHNQIKRDIPVGFKHRENKDLSFVFKHADPNLIVELQNMQEVNTKPIINQLGTLGGAIISSNSKAMVNTFG